MDVSEDRVLREKGFDVFPVLAGRWSRRPGDVYGRSPAMRALGDVIDLQHKNLREGEVIDLQTKPPIKAPSSMKTMGSKWLGKGITWSDSPDKIEPIYDGKAARLDHLRLSIEDVRRRIDRALYGDLFRMVSNLAALGIERTKYETSVLQQEKVSLLGPVGEHLYGEVLEPLVDITLHHMATAGILPPVPDELRAIGKLRVEFDSPLALAQRSASTMDTRSWLSELLEVAQTRAAMGDTSRPATDLVDFDRYARDSAHARGVPERFMRDDTVVQAEREARAMAQAAIQQTQMMESQSTTAKNLAQSPTDSQNALTDLNRQEN
jgi:hypothetical protein